MTASSNPAPGRSAPVRRWVLALAVVTVLAGVLLLTICRRQAPVAAIAEVPRSELELREGRWFRKAQGAAFTGWLVERDESGGLKSRSVVSNGWLEGLSEGWHTNGQRQVQEHFHAGISHGLRTKWYPDGRKLSEVEVVDGKLAGTFRQWNPDGSLAEEVELKDGHPDGLSRAYYPSGSVKVEARLRAGQVVAQQSWKDGERAGGSPDN